METLSFKLVDCRIAALNEKTVVEMYGLDEAGVAYKVTVGKFYPTFYCIVSDRFSVNNCRDFQDQINKEVGYRTAKSIVECGMLKRKNLYGYADGHKSVFVYFKFDSMAAYHRVKNLWYTEMPTTEVSRFNRRKGFKWAPDPNGYEFNGEATFLFEANIPPILRFYHNKSINPTGWVQVVGKKSGVVSAVGAKEYHCSYNDITAQPQKAVFAKRKICCFDIEASSESGQFPAPVADYRRPAVDIVDKAAARGEVGLETVLLGCALGIFGFAGYDKKDRVTPKAPVTEDQIEALVAKWFKHPIQGLAMVDGVSAVAEEESSEDEGEVGADPRGQTVLEVLADERLPLNSKVQLVNASMCAVFPAIEGDHVTFIGSTFSLHGEKDPYLRHCIALGETAPVEGVELVCCPDERTLLFEFTKLLKRENPDIVAGYNNSGFDEKFMYLRAKETKCDGFYDFSRGGERPDPNEVMDTNFLQLATGEYETNFLKMPGRVHMDLYTLMRKDGYSLDSFKLDDVAAHFICDKVDYVRVDESSLRIFSKNISGIAPTNCVVLETMTYSKNRLFGGEKLEILHVGDGFFDVRRPPGSALDVPEGLKNKFYSGEQRPTGKCKQALKWCITKNDVDHHQIFAWAEGTPEERARVATYCVQDANLVHELLVRTKKITEYEEMGMVCNVSIQDLVSRAQGYKVTSLIAKFCREHHFLMPVLSAPDWDDGYEGAKVIDPVCGIYVDEPVAVLDFKSLYPTNMIAFNLSMDSKVWAEEYDLQGRVTKPRDRRSAKYDNLPGKVYFDKPYDLFKAVRKTPKGKAEKVKCGTRVVRFEQTQKGILPFVLDQLLRARQETKKKAERETDESMKDNYDKRQLAYKVTANSLYGQCGARTSTFYDKDVAACCTAYGRELIMCVMDCVRVYTHTPVETKAEGLVVATVEPIYGDTDSVFIKFTVEKDGTRLPGKRALPVTMELAKGVAAMITKCLSHPHELEYEKIYFPFILQNKKKYDGFMYENDPNSGKLKSMGNVLKRRDIPPIVKDIYGGLIDCIMDGKSILEGILFLKDEVRKIRQGLVELEKFRITKSLRSGYKKPQQIAHAVLARRMGERDPGNRPRPGDRMEFAYVQTPKPGKGVKQLQGERIEDIAHIVDHRLQLDFDKYVEMIEKGLVKLLIHVLPEIPAFDPAVFAASLNPFREKLQDDEKIEKKRLQLLEKEVQRLIFKA